MTESNDQSVENPTDAPIEHGEVVDDAMAPIGDGAGEGDAVTSPAKVMRIGSMVKALLEEVRAAPLDEPSRERLAEIYERSVVELSEALSPDLQEELKSLALPFQDGVVPSESEIRVAKAQLVGWLEGLVPRDPGDAVRPAAGGPSAARANAPAPARRRAAPGAPSAVSTAHRPAPRHVSLE